MEEKKGFVQNITDNYRQLEKSIVNQLNLYNKNHSSTTGGLREEIWMQLFETIVPKKFVIEHSIFIIDSYNQISKEVDLAIIDNTYTPYIFQYGRLKYVPIEAVAAVIECKSTDSTLNKKDKDGNKIGLSVWCDSIQRLRTSLESIARMATGTVIEGKSYAFTRREDTPFKSTQTSTRPVRIFCGYKTKLTENNFFEIEKLFDFVLLASDQGEEERISVSVQKEKSLQEWYKELDHYGYDNRELIKKEGGDIEIAQNVKLNSYCLDKLAVKCGEEEISLLSFNFQLNQLLMLINNPILFPHLGYAKMFNGESRKWEE